MLALEDTELYCLGWDMFVFMSSQTIASQSKDGPQRKPFMSNPLTFLMRTQGPEAGSHVHVTCATQSWDGVLGSPPVPAVYACAQDLPLSRAASQLQQERNWSRTWNKTAELLKPHLPAVPGAGGQGLSCPGCSLPQLLTPGSVWHSPEKDTP